MDSIQLLNGLGIATAAILLGVAASFFWSAHVAKRGSNATVGASVERKAFVSPDASGGTDSSASSTDAELQAVRAGLRDAVVQLEQLRDSARYVGEPAHDEIGVDDYVIIPRRAFEAGQFGRAVAVKLARPDSVPSTPKRATALS